MPEFYEANPSLDNYWRAIILFGRNVASYKFALAQSLLEFSARANSFITLDELAEPFSRHLSNHLKISDKQTTSNSSKFLDACRHYNEGSISKEQLLQTTVKLGFVNVIDAFHVVNQGEVAVRFYTDERRGSIKGIRLTDEVYKLREHYQYHNLPHEVESRWRLVETAWELNLPRHTLTVSYDAERELFLSESDLFERRAITSSRGALNGYQKGKCFYCFTDISVDEGSPDLADVDHFFPHILKSTGIAEPVDGVWNLVLACQSCNRGENGKFARIPELEYLERLSKRNSYLIDSHHPLRETLMLQTGETPLERRDFLQRAYTEAVSLLVHKWRPLHEHEPAF